MDNFMIEVMKLNAMIDELRNQKTNWYISALLVG